jgi:hypothetical protein
MSLWVVDILIATLALVLEGPLAASIHAFCGRRLLLATDTCGYEIIGPQRNDAALVRAAAQAVRAAALGMTPGSTAPESPVGAALATSNMQGS